MLKYCLIVIYGILCVAAVIKISKHNGRDKSVNLALETVFEFDNDDKKTDINILNKVQKFIGKVKNVIENSNTARRQLSNTNTKVFSNFIIDVVQVLIQYDDRALENVASIISKEMENHQYDGCKFYELTDNIEQQKAFAKKLKEMKYKAGADIKDDLKAIFNKLSEEIYAKPEKELIDIINTVYQDYSVERLNNFLKGIDNHRQYTKDNNNITKVISEGLKTILFDHYTNLTIHLRTSLLSKLQDYMKYYNDDSLSKVSAVTKNKAMQTLRQMYIEKESLDENDHVEIVSKSKSRKHTAASERPLNIPTTRKLKSEYSKEILRNKKHVRHNKKHRFVKISKTSEEIPTVTHKIKGSGTTKELRTLRQMYVEKNIDLKYDPDAYERLTTAKKSKSKKHSYSPTTRKRTHEREKLKKNTPHKYTDKSQYERQPKEEVRSSESSRYKSDKSEERVLTDLVVDFPSEVKKTTQFKLTKMVRFFGQTFIDKDLDYYENTPGFRSGKKKLTFKTLYPTFVIDWTTPVRHGKRQFGGVSEFKARSPKHGGDGSSQIYAHQSGSGNGIKVVKDLDYSIEVRKPKNWELGVHKKGKSKGSRHHNENEQNPKAHERRLRKAAKHHSVHAPVSKRHDRESVDEKPKMSRDPMILARQYEIPLHAGRKQLRRQFRKPSVGSEEGLSIEGIKTNTHKIYYRRNNNSNTTDNFNKNVQVLKRIENLENEIELVKIRIKNDTYLKKNLYNNKPNILNSDMHKTNSITKATERSTTRREDENMDEVPGAKRANTDGLNKDSLETKEKNNHITNEQPVVTEREFIERKHNDYQYKSQSNTTKIVKEAVTLDSIKDQGRKANFSFEKSQEIKTDKDDTNIKSNETYDSINNKRVENGATDHDMRKSIKANIKNDEEIISSKITTEKSLHFRNHEEMSVNSYNVSADETVEMNYVPKISHIKDEPLHNRSHDNSWVEVVYRERQFKNKNEEKKAKENEIKDYSKPNKVNMETGPRNSKDKSGNFKVKDDFVFRATDGNQNSPQTTLDDSAKNREDIFKGNEETTVDIIAAIEKTVRKQTLTDKATTTVSKASETSVKQLEKVDKIMAVRSSDGNTAQNQKEGNKKEDLNTTPIRSGVNDTLAQKFANKSHTMSSNVTVN